MLQFLRKFVARRHTKIFGLALTKQLTFTSLVSLTRCSSSAVAWLGVLLACMPFGMYVKLTTAHIYMGSSRYVSQFPDLVWTTPFPGY